MENFPDARWKMILKLSKQVTTKTGFSRRLTGVMFWRRMEFSTTRWNIINETMMSTGG